MTSIDFRLIYEQHAEEVYKFLLRLCGNATLAEDLLQTTFLKAIEKVDTFDSRCKLTSWLCKIAKNSYYDHLRKTKRQPTHAIVDIELPDYSPSFEELLEDKDTAREIRAAVHLLPEPYKEVFLLRVYAELPFREIGQIFGKTEVWGRVTYLRAKEMVVKKLEERNY
ncbi:MAG: sigma-70 family RNA polymerase sigma factor [Lachnospiraceae bacterium]|nr:sigma-70 family RNA polymerase sigma factor [Lachnospiraceae bacterium]